MGQQKAPKSLGMENHDLCWLQFSTCGPEFDAFVAAEEAPDANGGDSAAFQSNPLQMRHRPADLFEATISHRAEPHVQATHLHQRH